MNMTAMLLWDDAPEYATVECEVCGMEGTEEDDWDDDGLCPYCRAQ